MNKYTVFIKSCLFTLIFSIFIFSAKAQISSNDALQMLKDGNERFCKDQMLHQHQDSKTVKKLIDGQRPFAIIVSCSDSRVIPDIIFDQGLGDIFSIRTAGNVMGDYELGSIEYAAEHLGTKLIVVKGHTKCGAINAFLDSQESSKNETISHTDHENLGHIQSIIDKFKSEEEVIEALQTKDNLHYRTVRANVENGVRQLKESEPILSHLYREGKIEVVGAIYHIETGKVEFLNR